VEMDFLAEALIVNVITAYQVVMPALKIKHAYFAIKVK
jgi:hypothetical protein